MVVGSSPTGRPNKIMIVPRFHQNILETPHDRFLLAIPVNTVGIAGKGLAKTILDEEKQVKKEYVDLCRDSSLKIGNPVVAKTVGIYGRRYILFPTKIHWSNPSLLNGLMKDLA